MLIKEENLQLLEIMRRGREGRDGGEEEEREGGRRRSQKQIRILPRGRDGGSSFAPHLHLGEERRSKGREDTKEEIRRRRE